MSRHTTITEDYVLPSKGKLYNKQFDPHIKLRSMTVADEMKRLSPSDNPYKAMSEIIEDCLITKLPISVYDLCLGDYTYLLHKLRVVTYGPEYTIQYYCPFCGTLQKTSINLDELHLNEFEDKLLEDMIITLPSTGHTVKLRFQTPRDLDRIANKAKEMKKQFPDMQGDPTLLLTLESLIESINGERVNPITIGETLKQLPMKDTNYIAQKATKLNGKVGIDISLAVTCSNCKSDVNTTFRYTNEFFGPEVD